MPLNLASPGIIVREVDLTIGRVDPVSGSIGALAAPFARGPVGLPQLIESEDDLYSTYGKPYNTDKQYESWMVASSYLAYGGNMQVVRTDDEHLKNATDDASPAIKIKNDDHYNQLGYDESIIAGVVVSAKNPGSWANGIKVATIDAKADQILTVANNVGLATVGYAVTQTMHGKSIEDPAQPVGSGSTVQADGYLKGIITEISTGKVGVKVLSHVRGDGTEVSKDYTPLAEYSFTNDGTIGISAIGGSVTTNPYAKTYTAQVDWFEQQEIALGGDLDPLEWDQIADRPSTSAHAAARGGRFDEVHVVVIDTDGKITGNAGTILEKHLNVSKAKDGEYSAGSPSYWRKWLKTNSQYIFGGGAPGLTTTAYETSATNTLDTDSGWDQDSKSVNFGAGGANTYTLSGGLDYAVSNTLDSDDTTGALYADPGDIISGLDLFANKELYEVDFILMGSGNFSKEQTRAIASKAIAVADSRKDAIAFISPYRGAFISDGASGTVTVENDDQITNNVLSFYNSLTSTTYGVFDSGYKYMYDRFNNTFRYVPLNGDIAGTCARTDQTDFPWFSPAGTNRGAILNVVKLPYNPGKAQRDTLYSNRINPVILSPGAGIVLFGDKTGYGKASAFDRINVRRLFIYLEDAISAAAKDQLFEFNDEITRTNFVNIIEPFLRDVQSKRGIFDYVVICDQTNNTAAVIDNNEFIADIYVKPARSINFIGLTFIATRTGVSFEEVIGNV